MLCSTARFPRYSVQHVTTFPTAQLDIYHMSFAMVLSERNLLIDVTAD